MSDASKPEDPESRKPDDASEESASADPSSEDTSADDSSSDDTSSDDASDEEEGDAEDVEPPRIGDEPGGDGEAHPAVQPPSEGADDEPTPVPESCAEMEALIGELRAEVTRLRVQQARERTRSWVQRHPVAAVSLSVVLGAVGGYVGARLQEKPPTTLTDRARRRLSRLAEEARDLAADVQGDLGAQLQDLGRRVVEESRRLAREAGSASESTADRFRELGDRAQGDGAAAADAVLSRAREAKEALGRRAREVSEQARTLPEKATSTGDGAVASAVSGAIEDRIDDDGAIPKPWKVKAATVAATTVGAAVGRKLLRSATSVAGSMLVAYLLKKLLAKLRG